MTGWTPARLAIGVTMTVCIVALVVPLAAANHGTLQNLSSGPAGGNGAANATFGGASQDGARAFFQTSESLVAGDTDAFQDVYERSGAGTTLISTAPGDGNGPNNATFRRASADGTRVFFVTNESIVAPDTDQSIDIYERSGGTTALISIGPAGGTGTQSATFQAASSDGSRVIFTTLESLVTEDTDTSVDLYERAGSTTTLLSTGPAGGNGPFGVTFQGASADGTRVFFQTDEALMGTDTDSSSDVYEASGGTTTQVSTGPTGGNGALLADWVGASQDGTRVFFVTSESLTADDLDTSRDVYEYSGGTTTRISANGTGGGNGAFIANFDGASADGTRVFFRSHEALATGDLDNSRDIFERVGSTTNQVSTGPAGGNGAFITNFAGASADGTRVFFTTDEALTTSDLDTVQDLYERSSGTTTQVSTGPMGGNGAFAANFDAASADGTRVFFRTHESLTADDTDSQQDVYERFTGATTRLSFGFTGGNGAFDSTFVGASSDATKLFFHTNESLVAGDTDSAQDVYGAGIAVTAQAARSRSATPVRVALVPAYEECTDPNSAHPAPVAKPSCNPPQLVSDFLRVGGNPGTFGFVSLRAKLGNETTIPDEADLLMDVSIDDVRNLSDGTDYTGELQLLLDLRITDRQNGTGASHPATLTDHKLAFAFPCTDNGGTNGAECSASTTADTLVPGMVTESKRTIYRIGEVHVFDGGADGVAATDPNTLFATQGLFVP